MIIKNLVENLKSEESVFIGDVGLFKIEHRPAKMVGAQLFPPQNALIFEQTDKGNGFAFTLYVSRAENLRIVDADMQVRAWTEQLKSELNKVGLFRIEHFGTFQKIGEKITFEAEFIPALNIAYEGMEVLDIQPVTIPSTTTEEVKTEPLTEPKTEEISEPISEPKVEEKVEISVEEKMVETTEVEDIQEIKEKEEEEIGEEIENSAEEKEKKRKKKSGSWVGNLLFIIVILGSLALLAYLFREPLLVKYQELREKFGEPQPTVPAPVDSTENAAATFEEDTLVMEEDTTFSAIDSAFVVEPSAEPTEPTPATQPILSGEDFPIIHFEKGKYYLIAGSLNNEAEAMAHAKTKQKQGFSPQVLHQSGTSRVRVCVAIFDNEAEATAFQQRHKNLWILQ